MTTRVIQTMVTTISLGALSAMAMPAQHEGHSTTTTTSRSAPAGNAAMSHDQMMMANEPHHVLAMAHHQSLALFAKALHQQTDGASSVNVEFARAAVAEMRRSADQMTQHHQAHMQTMSTEMHTAMSGMMQQMESHHAELAAQLSALEQEVKSTAPDAKTVSSLAASVHAHLDAMSRMHPGSKMKMKHD